MSWYLITFRSAIPFVSYYTGFSYAGFLNLLLLTKTRYLHLPHENSLSIKEVMNNFLSRSARIQVQK